MADETRSLIGEATLAEVGAGEPAWLAAIRARAWELHRDLPLPDRALHRWRYVDPARLMPAKRALRRETDLRTTGAPATDSNAAVVLRRGPGGASVTMTDAARAAGVEVMDLSRAATLREDLVRAVLGRLVPATDSPFAAFNAAFWSGGLFVFAPPGVRLEQPIHLCTESGSGGVAAARYVVVVGEGADVTIIEELTGVEGRDEGSMVHRVDEVVVGPGARLQFVAIQELPVGTISTSATRVRLDQGAELLQLFASFGGGVAKADLTVDLRGAGARADVLGVVFGAGRQHFDHHTVLEHHAPDTTTNLDVRVALAGRAKSSATGRLYIGPEAIRSQAYQENRNLLLSEQASAITIPELEILTDEVQAKHGATIGPIDEEQIYYLNSRGLSPDEASAMIVGGFFETVVARVPDGLAQERVRTRVEARLGASRGR